MEKTINSSIIYKGKIITVYKDDVLVEKNGGVVKSIREVVKHHGGAVGLVKTKDNKVLFVSQFRYPFKEKIIELPAGKVEENENSLETIYRELMEEVGVKANKIEYVGKILVSPGYCDEAVYMYYVDDYVETIQNFDVDENLEVLAIDIPKVFEMVDNGEIIDGKTLCLLLKKKDELLKK